MRYAIIPKDSNKAINIRDDVDFKDILRDRVGNDAAEYYEIRIKEFKDIFNQLTEALLMHKKSKIRDEMLEHLKNVTEGLFD